MEKPRLLTNMFGHVRQEGDNVVLCFPFDFVDTFDFECATRPHGLCGVVWYDAQIGHRVEGMGLDLKPYAKTTFGRPEGNHFGA